MYCNNNLNKCLVNFFYNIDKGQLFLFYASQESNLPLNPFERGIKNNYHD